MALATHLLPFGIRDIKVTPTGTVLGTMVDLPGGRTMSWADSADFEELRGDDQVLAERETGGTVDWDLESGGISLEAYAVFAGGTVSSSGVTPNVKKTYSKDATVSRPYFLAEGQAINDNGGDTHLVLWRCKATGNIEGSFEEGSFDVTSLSGKAYPDPLHTNKLYDIVANETAAAIIQPV